MTGNMNMNLQMHSNIYLYLNDNEHNYNLYISRYPDFCFKTIVVTYEKCDSSFQLTFLKKNFKVKVKVISYLQISFN